MKLVLALWGTCTNEFCTFAWNSLKETLLWHQPILKSSTEWEASTRWHQQRSPCALLRLICTHVQYGFAITRDAHERWSRRRLRNPFSQCWSIVIILLLRFYPIPECLRKLCCKTVDITVGSRAIDLVGWSHRIEAEILMSLSHTARPRGWSSCWGSVLGYNKAHRRHRIMRHWRAWKGSEIKERYLSNQSTFTISACGMSPALLPFALDFSSLFFIAASDASYGDRSAACRSCRSLPQRRSGSRSRTANRTVFCLNHPVSLGALTSYEPLMAKASC